MNRRAIFKLTRRFCSIKEAEPIETDKQPQKINFHPSELYPFKFRHEQYSLYQGFTEEEIFGMKYGYKHAPQISREIKKDSIMFILMLLGIFTYMNCSRDINWKVDEGFKNYITYDQNVVRPNPAGENK